MFQYFHPPTIPPFHYSTIPLFPTLRLTLPVPSRGGLLPARPPLRTVLESFPSYGSSRSNRCALSRADGGNRATNGILRVTRGCWQPKRLADLPSARATQNSGACRSIRCSVGRRGWRPRGL